MPKINLDITINIGTEGLIEIQQLTFDSSYIKKDELKKQINDHIITLYNEGFNFENQDINCLLKPSEKQPPNKGTVGKVHHTILGNVINDATVLELVQTAIDTESTSNKKLSSSTKLHHHRVAPPPLVDALAVKPRPHPQAPPKAENTTGNKGSMQEALRERMDVQRKAVNGDGPRNSYDKKNCSGIIPCNLTLIKVGERDPRALDISGNNKLYIYKNIHGHIQFRFEYEDNLKPAVEKLLEKPACLDDCDDDSDNDSDWSDGEEVKSSEKTSEYNPGELASLQLNDKNAYLELSDVLAL
ncbi:MAG TPA: hypothetical protein DDY37_03155, partial [Legionella sp.]|nr:hypothetical protein [Legionella sp.]